MKENARKIEEPLHLLFYDVRNMILECDTVVASVCACAHMHTPILMCVRIYLKNSFLFRKEM